MECSEVTMENFGAILNWFGPLKGKEGSSFMDTVRSTLRNTWFHGDLQTEESNRLLEMRPSGTFLVRFSTAIRGAFTISKVDVSGKSVHQRIVRKGNSFCMSNKEFPSLETLVSEGQGALHLLSVKLTELY